MIACQTAVRIVILIFCLKYKGGFDVQVTYADVNNIIIHDINATSAVFECSKRLIVRCYGPKNAFVKWKINNSLSLGTSLSAQCFAGFECDVFNNFTGRYSFGYNSSTGISDLTIDPVSFDDNGTEYKCSDTAQPLKAVVKDVLGNHSYSLQNVTSAEGSDIIFNLRINCTAEFVTIEWFSTAIDGTGILTHEATFKTESECLLGDCIKPGTSKARLSRLELERVSNNKVRRKRALEAGRVFGYNITADSFHVSLLIPGTYKLKVGCIPGTTEPIACWIFGIIVVGTAIVAGLIIICVIEWIKHTGTTKDLCPCVIKGAFIEVAVIIFVIVIIIFVVRFVQKSKDDCTDTFSCWKILVIVLFVFIFLLAMCGGVYIILEPVHSVIVLSRTVQGEQMTVKIQWSARWFRLKKFYADFESEINESCIKEMNYKPLYDGHLECVIGGLSLDNDYQAQVYSKICNIRSLGKTILFDTKGRALPPQSFTEEEQQRTESSVTLKWIPAKGHTDHYYIKYKRQKEQREVWKVTPVIKNSYYTIDKLKSGTTYTFKIFAVNSIGHSDESSLLPIRTNAIETMPPENFEPIEVNANDVKLSWKPSNKLKKQIFVLHLTDKTTGSNIDEHEIQIPYDGKNQMIYTVKDLKPGAKYSLKILTCVGKRKSEYSKAVEIQTKGFNT